MAERRKDKKGRNLRTGESQRKDGRYMYRWTQDGKERSVYALTLGELREKETQIQKDIQDDINSYTANLITLNAMFEKNMESKTEIRPSTKRVYQEVYSYHVHDTIGTQKIRKIRYSDVKKFYVSLVEKQGLSIATVKNINACLHQTFKLALRDGIIRYNPCDGVIAEVNYLDKKKKRHALTIEEQNAFMEYVANSRFKRWLPLFTVLLGTGCRIGEIAGLTWKNCDFENDIILIDHTLMYRPIGNDDFYKYHINKTKTKSGERSIPMLRVVREALLQEKKEQKASGIKSKMVIDGYSDFVFINSNGNPYYSQAVNNVIKRIYTSYNKKEENEAIKENREKILLRPFTAHNLRHTFATRFCENETNLKVIQDIMGHSDISTTMNIYAEATKEAKKQSMDALEGKFKIK